MVTGFFRFTSTVRNHSWLFLFLIAGVWEMPLLIRYPDISLDSSWNLGINMAFSVAMQFGKDIVFADGLLSVLENTVLNTYTLWRMNVFFLIVVQVLFIIAIYLLLRSLSARWYHYLLFLPFFVMVLPIARPHWSLLLTISIFLYLLLTSRTGFLITGGGLVCAGFLLAVVSLLKFDMLLNALALFAFFFILGYLTHRGPGQGLVLLASYLCSFAGIWLMTGQELNNLPPYLLGGWELARGYTAAMSTWGPSWQVLVGLSVLVYIGLIFFLFFLSGERKITLFLALNLFILFSSFKSAFVRHDTGHIIEGAWILVFFLLIILVSCGTLPRASITGLSSLLYPVVTAVFILVLAYMLLGAAPWIPQANLVSRFDTSMTAIQWLTNETLFDQQVALKKADLQEDYALSPDLVHGLKNRSTAVIPWDINLVWAYGLNWSPQPVIQSYSAYTPYLDGLNRAHIQDAAPDTLFYSYKSIDARYPLFDEPSAFSSILHRYTVLNRSGEFILLNRLVQDNDRVPIPLGSATGRLGTALPVPEYAGEVYGTVHLPYTPGGALLTILYKPEPLYIRFLLKNGMISERYRFIPGTAENGIFLSQFVGDIDTLSWIFEGNLIHDIGSIIIETDHPWYYADSFPVDFTGIPHLGEGSDNLLVTHPITFRHVVFQEQHPSYSFKNLNGTTKIAFFEHSLENGSSILIENVSIGNDRILRFATALDPLTWSPDKGDGVEYRVHVLSGARDDLVFSGYLDPKNNRTERTWNTQEVNLSAYAGQTVTLQFSTFPGPGNDTAWDWAWWGDPEILPHPSGSRG